MNRDIRDSLAQVVALLDRATPGEWFSDQHCPCNEGREANPDVSLWGSDGITETFICNIAFDWSRAADAEACAAAVNFLREHGPALLAVVEGRHE